MYGVLMDVHLNPKNRKKVLKKPRDIDRSKGLREKSIDELLELKHRGKTLGFINKIDASKLIGDEILNCSTKSLSDLRDLAKGIPLVSLFLEDGDIQILLKREQYRLGLSRFEDVDALGVRGNVSLKAKIEILRIASKIREKQLYYHNKIGKNQKAKEQDLSNIDLSSSEGIKEYLDFDLTKLREAEYMSGGRDYIKELFETKGIFVSLGTNYPGVMPVTRKEKVIGAFWVPNPYDQTHPWIFVDTKDDLDKKNDPIGRQIFSMLLMLVFYLNGNKNIYFNRSEFERNKTNGEDKLFKIVENILLPAEDLKVLYERWKNNNTGIQKNIDYEFIAGNFEYLKATPTFLLKRMKDLNLLLENHHATGKLIRDFEPIRRGKVRFTQVKCRLNFNGGEKYFVPMSQVNSFGSASEKSNALFGKNIREEKMRKYIQDTIYYIKYGKI